MKKRNIIMGQFDIEQREDGMFNATSMLKQWNEDKKDCKSITDFVSKEMDFNEFFTGKRCFHGFSVKDGILWLNELCFGNFLCYLSPELFLVLYQRILK